MKQEKKQHKKFGKDINRKTIDDAQFEMNETRIVLYCSALKKKKKSINVIEKMQKKRNNDKISKRMSGCLTQDITHSIAQTPTHTQTHRNIFSMLNELE